MDWVSASTLGMYLIPCVAYCPQQNTAEITDQLPTAILACKLPKKLIRDKLQLEVIIS